MKKIILIIVSLLAPMLVFSQKETDTSSRTATASDTCRVSIEYAPICNVLKSRRVELFNCDKTELIDEAEYSYDLLQNPTQVVFGEYIVWSGDVGDSLEVVNPNKDFCYYLCSTPVDYCESRLVEGETDCQKIEFKEDSFSSCADVLPCLNDDDPTNELDTIYTQFGVLVTEITNGDTIVLPSPFTCQDIVFCYDVTANPDTISDIIVGDTVTFDLLDNDVITRCDSPSVTYVAENGTVENFDEINGIGDFIADEGVTEGSVTYYIFCAGLLRGVSTHYFTYIETTADAVNDMDTTLVNTPTSFDIGDNDTDCKNGNLTYEIEKYPQYGIAEILNANVEYTPFTDFVGNDTLVYGLYCNGVLIDMAEYVVTVLGCDLSPSFSRVTDGTDCNIITQTFTGTSTPTPGATLISQDFTTYDRNGNVISATTSGTHTVDFERADSLHKDTWAITKVDVEDSYGCKCAAFFTKDSHVVFDNVCPNEYPSWVNIYDQIEETSNFNNINNNDPCAIRSRLQLYQSPDMTERIVRFNILPQWLDVSTHNGDPNNLTIKVYRNGDPTPIIDAVTSGYSDITDPNLLQPGDTFDVYISYNSPKCEGGLLVFEASYTLPNFTVFTPSPPTVSWGTPTWTDATGGGDYGIGALSINGCDGNPLTVGEATIRVNVGSTGHFYEAVFNIGDDLSSAAPISETGSLPWGDLSTHFTTGSVIGDGSTVTLLKKDWATATGYTYVSKGVSNATILYWSIIVEDPSCGLVSEYDYVDMLRVVGHWTAATRNQQSVDDLDGEDFTININTFTTNNSGEYLPSSLNNVLVYNDGVFMGSPTGVTGTLYELGYTPPSYPYIVDRGSTNTRSNGLYGEQNYILWYPNDVYASPINVRPQTVNHTEGLEDDPNSYIAEYNFTVVIGQLPTDPWIADGSTVIQADLLVAGGYYPLNWAMIVGPTPTQVIVNHNSIGVYENSGVLRLSNDVRWVSTFKYDNELNFKY